MNCLATQPRSCDMLGDYILCSSFLFFFFNDTATTEIYTLSLHDALPISRRARRLEKLPSGERSVRAHCQARCAARWMAARIRWYVPQRQMFVIAASMSASLGLGLLASSAAAAMI